MRVLLALVLLIGVVYFVSNSGSGLPGFSRPAPAGGATGTGGTIDTEKARERGAEIGEKTAVAADRIGEAAHEAGFTAKIKAKLALDDTVRSRSVEVSTDGTVVTLRGGVRSQAEHDRVVALARETAGVTQVIDHLTVSR